MEHEDCAPFAGCVARFGARLKYPCNQETVWRGRLVTFGLHRRTKSALFVISFTLAVAAALAIQVDAAGKIYITGISSSAASPNSIVRVYGGGAASKDPIHAMLSGPINQTVIVGNESFPWVIVGPNNLSLGSTVANDFGDWVVDFTTPNAFPGDYNVYVVDETSLTSDVVPFQVLLSVVARPLNPFLINSVLPSTGPPGTVVTIRGTGASGGGIEVFFDEVNVGSVGGYHWGDWSATFSVPHVAVGNHMIEAIDGTSEARAVSVFSVTPAGLSSLSVFPLSLFLIAAGVLSGVATLMLLLAASKKRK